MDAKTYYGELLKKAGATEDVQQAILKALDDEKVSKALADDLIAPRLRQDDYSRKMDEAAAKDRKMTEWYQAELTKHNEVLALEQKYLAKLAETGETTLVTTPTGFDEKKFREEQAEREQRTLALFKDGLRLASRHAVEFKEELDTDALAKLAVEKNLPLTGAYNEMMRERREALAKTAREAELAAAKAEGAREFASTHKIPVDSKPKEPHLIFDAKPQSELPPAGPLRDRALRNSFQDAWNEAAATSGATK